MDPVRRPFPNEAARYPGKRFTAAPNPPSTSQGASKSWRRPAETRWRRPETLRVSGRRDRRCRSARSICRSRDRQSCRRGAATPRSRRPTGRRRSSHNGPSCVRGCIAGQDRPPSGFACTSRTRRQVAPNACTRARNVCDAYDDDERASLLRHSKQTRRAIAFQPQSYALLDPLRCWEGDRFAIDERRDGEDDGTSSGI